jgi:all-trans-8'-apo-beta-carotenal 15,15'-oxygenase
MSGAAIAHDLAPLLERCFLFEATEASCAVVAAEGKVPAWLRGTYYVNGPARFERAGLRYQHWLDGDGMVCALRFGADSIQFTSRFVQTKKLHDEEDAGRFLYRGFGTAFPGDRLRRGVMLEPPVNITVLPFAGSLLAFGEQSLPMELDPFTLATRGAYDFQGALNEVSPFAAHAKIEPATQRLVNFGISYAAAQPALYTYEFDDTGCLLARRRFELPHAYSNHDFGLTPRYSVFYLSPLLMDFARLREGASVLESLYWAPELGSRLLLAPRANGSESIEIPIPAAYCLHLINCFEQDDRLMVDVVELDEPIYPQYQPMPDLFASAIRGRPVRYVVDLAAGAVRERVCLVAYDRAPDFPSLDPQLHGAAYDDFWMLGISHAAVNGRKSFDELVHASWSRAAADDVYRLPAGEYFGGEPVFAANPYDQEQAVIIVQHHTPAEMSSGFLLFAANAVHAGPIARIPLKQRLHPGFHACFSSAGAPMRSSSKQNAAG